MAQITALTIYGVSGQIHIFVAKAGVPQEEVVVGSPINIELLRRKREKDRLEFILAEDEELLMAVAATMEVIKNRWVH